MSRWTRRGFLAAGLSVAGCTRLDRPLLGPLYRPTQDSTDQPPLIVIPGAFGSRLRDRRTGREIWPRSDRSLLVSSYRALPGYRIDWERTRAAVTPRTRLIVVNTPNNPGTSVLAAADLDALADVTRGTPIVVVADEVYEHMVYDGVPHVSAACIPGLAERAFVVSSFGKTYHVTGWKVGYVAAPAPLTTEFRKVHQFNVFTVNTPVQHGLASYMADPRPYLQLPAFYQRKRDLFVQGLRKTRLSPLPSAGTYFQCVEYGEVNSLPEADFCQWLTRGLLVPAGSLMRGVVSSVDKAGRLDRKGSLTLTFDQLTVRGVAVPVRATVTQTIESPGVKKEFSKVGAGAGMGAMIGGMIAGPQGAAAGVFIGAGGALFALPGKDVGLSSGAILGVRFDAPVMVR